MKMKKTTILMALILAPIFASAKEFTINCVNSSKNEFSYTFNEERKTVTSSGLEANAKFYENEIVFKLFGWLHTLNRTSGYMLASDDEKSTTQMKCALVTKRMF
jgi:hypothetical protein